ncbi:MAG TPA: hypothetical protein VFQ53_04570 [Kofleriaceae bacterium]|nr:hypothetical protein [Kofleriaceae bacterium]
MQPQLFDRMLDQARDWARYFSAVFFYRGRFVAVVGLNNSGLISLDDAPVLTPEQAGRLRDVSSFGEVLRW